MDIEVGVVGYRIGIHIRSKEAMVLKHPLPAPQMETQVGIENQPDAQEDQQKETRKQGVEPRIGKGGLG